MRRLTGLMALMAILAAGACAAPTAPVSRGEVTALAAGIGAMGPGVDPEEAARAARIALAWSQELARQYQITDPPLIHNTKVNLGLKPRGLCWHWAEDMENRLRQENFRTLEVQRAIATPDVIGIDHSTALVTLPGGTMDQGMILDPWRNGGRLFWAPTAADTRYNWRPQAEVLAEKRRQMVALGAIAPSG